MERERFELFTGLITEIAKYIRKIKTTEMQEFDLKSSHVSCLYYLFRHTTLTVKELSELSNEDKASVSRTLDNLQSNGLIVRTEEVKRYKSPIYLTEQGKAVGERIAEKVDRILFEVSDGLTSTEREAMYRYLIIVKDNLKKVVNNEYNAANTSFCAAAPKSFTP